MIDVLGTKDGSGPWSSGASPAGLVGRGGGSRRTLGKTEFGSLELGDVDNLAGTGEARLGRGGAWDLTESLLDLYPSASSRLVLLSGRDGIGGGCTRETGVCDLGVKEGVMVAAISVTPYQVLFINSL
jgi:hypothetical protein